MKKLYRSFHVSGISPRDLEAELRREFKLLQENEWNIERVDLHYNPHGYGDKNYIPKKEYIIIAWHEDIEE